jgi:HK97 family phage major capsid protein
MPDVNTLIKETSKNLEGFIDRHQSQVTALEHRIFDLENESARSAITGGRGITDEPVEARVHLESGDKLTDYLAREKGITCPDSGHGFGHLARALVTGAKSDFEVQALSKGTDASGGYAVPEWYAAEVIDLMRSKLAIDRAGARTVPLEGDKTHFLRIESDPVAGWRLESGAVKESDMTFGRTTFNPKSLAVIVKVTRELLEDGVNVEWSLRHAFAAAFAQELDRVALFGSGTNPEPLGVVNTPGIQTYTLAADGAPVTSYAPIVRARGMMLAANTNEPTAAIMAPRTATAFEELTDTTGQPLQRPRSIENLPFLPTTLTPVDDEHGEAENASRVIVGDFSNLWIGVRTGFRIEVLREHFADTMTVAFLAHLRADIQVTHPAAFVDIPGFVPAA